MRQLDITKPKDVETLAILIHDAFVTQEDWDEMHPDDQEFALDAAVRVMEKYDVHEMDE